MTIVKFNKKHGVLPEGSSSTYIHFAKLSFRRQGIDLLCNWPGKNWETRMLTLVRVGPENTTKINLNPHLHDEFLGLHLIPLEVLADFLTLTVPEFVQPEENNDN